MDRPAWILPALLGVMLSSQMVHAADPEPPIDWDKARQLYQREQKGQKLTADEQAYLDRAKTERRRQQGERGPTTRPGAAGLTPRESTGFKPLTEMTTDDRYKGEDGGLYGGGSNDPPKEHAAAAAAAVAKIQPLNAEGKPADDGKIVLVSMGMSNTTQEFSLFREMAIRDADRSPRLAIVDAAQGGMAAPEWNEAATAEKVWAELDRRLKENNVTPQQVQIVYIKQAVKGPGQYGEFPAHAKKLKEAIVGNLQRAQQHFPNLRLAFLSSRTYGGYARSQLNPEPFAYEGAFAMRWVIQDQIRGAKELNHDSANGDVKAPVVLWGPYLWADGVKPRKNDGLIYKAEDFGPDGTHPSLQAGRQKIADVMLKFFKTDPYTKQWFVKPGAKDRGPG